MNIQMPEILLWIVGQCVVAAAIWGGIRADIRGIHNRLDANETRIARLHERLDRHLESNWHGGTGSGP